MEEREILSLIISSCVAGFVLLQWHKLKGLPGAKAMLAAFFLLYAGWILSVVEDLFWETALNLLQHACNGASGVFLALWSRALFLTAGGRGAP